MQKFAVMRARQLGKPVIVAHQLLHSMIEYPIPTRAEVADVADVVRQRADALMLSGAVLRALQKLDTPCDVTHVKAQHTCPLRS